MELEFDVLVVGAGPGGYVAAIRAAQLGLKVACVDNFIRNDKYSLGGTCLNVGCIPSKALLESSENYSHLLHSFAEHGITCDNPKIDVKKMIARKDSIIDKLTTGISFLFKKNKINELHGTASFVKKDGQFWIIQIIDDNKNQIIRAKHVILATGSSVRQLENVNIDNKLILDNQGALALKEVPVKLGIIGAGVIGLEMGSVWSRLGSKVTVLESATKFLSSADEQIAGELQKQLVKQDLDIKLGIKINKVSQTNNKVVIEYLDNNKSKILECDKLIVSIGRIPNLNGLNHESVGLSLDDRGFIKVDAYNKTNLENIWAIGDCVRGPMLAHKASEEGILVAEQIVGQKPHFDLNTVPWIIYTQPEVAWVGQTEQQLQSIGIKYNKGLASFIANGRALGIGSNQGFIKILADANTDRILGVHMVGALVSELISEAVVAMEFKASSEDLARIIHAHPLLSEVIHEAALDCNKRQIHA